MELPKNESTAAPRIDFSRLQEIVDTPPEMREFLELYLRETEEQLTQLKEALAQNNPTTVRTLAHTAAGASATCGMQDLVPIFKQLESRGKEGNLAGCDELYRQAVADFDRLKNFLTAYLRSIR
jgi:HPt (histidine-containing phosphotransfer) domain-containing protein